MKNGILAHARYGPKPAGIADERGEENMTLVKRQGRGTWPDEYRGLYQPTFVEVQGRIFVLGT